MSESDRLARKVEVDLLAADARFYFDLANNPYLEPIQANAVLSLMPFLSSFAYDSYEYLKSRKIAGTEFPEPHRRLLLTSRLRMKPLEIDRKSFDDVLDDIDYLVEAGERWFVGDYPRPLRALRQLWQPDVGVQFIGDEVFSTTHVSSLNLGLSQEMLEGYSLAFDDLGKFMFDMSRDVGRYTAALADAIGVPLDVRADYARTDPPSLRYSDHFSRKLYPLFADTVSERPAACVLLTAVVSQVNFARLLLPYMTIGNELAAFKIRFLSLYHAASTLDELMKVQSQREVLKATAVERVKEARSSRAVRAIKGYHLLRNTLIHYNMQAKKVGLLSEDKDRFGFVEAHAKGHTLPEVMGEVEEGLDHLSRSLGSLLPKGLTPKHDFD